MERPTRDHTTRGFCNLFFTTMADLTTNYFASRGEVTTRDFATNMDNSTNDFTSKPYFTPKMVRIKN